MQALHVYLREVEKNKAPHRGDTVYLVTYDIPTGKRQLFYYHLRRQLAGLVMPYIDLEYDRIPSVKEILAAAEAEGIYVRKTKSVIETGHREIAETVYEVASRFGEAHIYVARRLA